ncbi:AAA family ATPase [Mycetocola reblochoni]|uniref:AAA family ATPase n=1 Tax=Mycetocola reblochoni TaxID=331618 RepID=UPI003F97F699
MSETPAAEDAAETTRSKWRAELSVAGGRSPLLHFVDASGTHIELSTTHPGGLPQFIMGRSTLLSSLIRDELALRRARIAAERITDKGIEMRTVRGIEAIHLAVGLATWRHDDVEYEAPVLLRPMAIRRYGRDFELKLRGNTVLNPELARVMQQQFGITLDATAFEELAVTTGDFKPQPVIDRLRSVTTHIESFAVHPRLVVSSFADVGAAMVRDLEELDHPVLDALAGDEYARRTVSGLFSPVDAVGQDERPPATDTLLLDADTEQENVIAQIEAGQSVVVTSLPGTGGTQTVVNALGALVAQHRRVLVVSARRATLDGIRHRLERVGVPGMAAQSLTLRRELIQAITRNEKAQAPRTADIDDALVRLRRVLLDYRTSLQRTHPRYLVSVIDAMEALTRLGALPEPPLTTARLDADALAALAERRDEAAAKLAAAAALGEFQYGPGDSPWYGADFDATADAQAAHALAKKLNSVELPRFLERAYELIGQTRMRPFESIDELGVYLRLLLDIRDTLDRFLPAVFDRPLGELIAATSNRRDAQGMSAVNRRRLRKLAREYVRPGVHVGDLNESLRKIQQQRTLWQRYVSAGVAPDVPLGINDVQVAYQKIAADLTALDRPLGRARDEALTAVPINELVRVMAGLAADSTVMDNLQERTTLITQLRELGLDPLINDLSVRHVPERRVASELELAWWQSVLERMLAEDKALLGANTSVIDRLESDFRLVDDAHAAASGAVLAASLADAWKVGLVDWPGEASALKQLLRGDRVTAETVHRVAPHLFRTLSPVWMSSPYEVAQLPEDIVFDTVILVDAGATTLAENAGAIRRAKQVVAVGDPVTQSPTPFRTAIGTSAEPPLRAEHAQALHDRSAINQLASLLPSLTLTHSYRAGGEDLAELVNRRFYGGEIESLPWAGSFLGHGSLTIDYVPNGHGMPDPETGGVESVDAEVERVVNLVLEHARERPRESLMVVTASNKHATRVQQAVLAAFSTHTELAGFLLRERAEPFGVYTLEQSVAESRDRVIFSLGYGVTPHGRVLSNFGALAEPGGDRLLAVGMTRARRSMRIVSCIRPDDFEEGRIQHGVAALAQILAQSEPHEPAPANTDDAAPMMVDLAERLYTRGLQVEVGYRGKIALVVADDETAVAIESDGEVASDTLRESLRLRPGVLRRLGWHYLRVHSFDLFSDPDAVADRVVEILNPAPVEPLAPVTEPIAVIASPAVDTEGVRDPAAAELVTTTDVAEAIQTVRDTGVDVADPSARAVVDDGPGSAGSPATPFDDDRPAGTPPHSGEEGATDRSVDTGTAPDQDRHHDGR